MTSNEFADAADCCYGCNTMYNLSIYIFNLFIRGSCSSNTGKHLLGIYIKLHIFILIAYKVESTLSSLSFPGIPDLLPKPRARPAPSSH